jgi:hypothetical protein
MVPMCVKNIKYFIYYISLVSVQYKMALALMFCVREPFVKFVDAPYYSESELCGGAVTVSFSKYLPWQAMHFLQRSTNFSKTELRSF